MSEYKIFLGERFFLISDDIEKCFKSVNGIGTRLDTFEQVNIFFDFFEKSLMREFYIYTESPDSVFDVFIANNKYICAAGGVVYNVNDELLLINRLGYWDFPKGKIERGEEEVCAACREIEEECGISGVTATDKITDTYHVYMLKGERVIKRTAWYNVQYNGNEALIPQIEEDITEVKWVHKDRLYEYTPKMYASVKEVIGSINK